MNEQTQEEVEPEPQPQQEPEPQPQPQPRKKRTATRLIDHKEPQEVDFNNIGKKQSMFANDCGVITRSMIFVEYTSWKKVPIAQKDMLWSTIKVDVQTQISEGDLVLNPGEDLLTKVTIDLMGSQLAKLQEHFDLQHVSRNHAPDDVSLGVQHTNCSSTPKLDALDEKKMPSPYESMLPYGELDQKCAKGSVFPYGNGLIHRLPLRENHLKVMIDDIDSIYENFPLSVMTKEVANLQGAVCTVIQWPQIAIILAKEQRAKKQIPTTSLVPTIARLVQTRTYPTKHPARRG
ncbi:unnamed protein product [Lactuca saligna]|uniref:DUF8039 domain-containing protein n=1 Tax=Lactuca saligna TaxID=75948 RepID=A0AA35YXE9_LACSI|nr:unnamed protein product [Lactuca saligna]